MIPTIIAANASTGAAEAMTIATWVTLIVGIILFLILVSSLKNKPADVTKMAGCGYINGKTKSVRGSFICPNCQKKYPALFWYNNTDESDWYIRIDQGTGDTREHPLVAWSANCRECHRMIGADKDAFTKYEWEKYEWNTERNK